MELENTVQPGVEENKVEENHTEETHAEEHKAEEVGNVQPPTVEPPPTVEADTQPQPVANTEHTESGGTANGMIMKVKRMHKDAILPTYGTEGSGALDFYAAEDVTVWEERTYRIGLGVALEVPVGYVLQLVPRSSMGVDTPLRMPNSMGVIDSDYRGEVAAIYVNDETKGMIPYQINKGDRIAQGYLVPTPKINLVEVEELSDTDRGDNGFGSTGK
nr:MAG TPA: dUTPase [Bacteriophage sp.]